MSQAVDTAGTRAEGTSGEPASPALSIAEVTRPAIAEISHIATLPEVTMKIIKLVEDPESTAQDLNKVISNDPALGARILKVVNSAFYGLPGQIGSINRAIVLLGLNAVKNIAIAASLAKLFRGGKVSALFDARDLWTHSICSATCCRMLAHKVGLGLPDEAFLAGLIHDIGIMVEVQARRAKFVEMLELRQGKGLTFRAAELEVLHAHHEHFGKELCKVWKFPGNLQLVSGHHHEPLSLPEGQRTLPALCYLSDFISRDLEQGFAADVEAEQPDPAVLEVLKLGPKALDEVKQKLPDALKEAQTVFSQPA